MCYHYLTTSESHLCGLWALLGLVWHLRALSQARTTLCRTQLHYTQARLGSCAATLGLALKSLVVLEPYSVRLLVQVASDTTTLALCASLWLCTLCLVRSLTQGTAAQTWPHTCAWAVLPCLGVTFAASQALRYSYDAAVFDVVFLIMIMLQLLGSGLAHAWAYREVWQILTQARPAELLTSRAQVHPLHHQTLVVLGLVVWVTPLVLWRCVYLLLYPDETPAVLEETELSTGELLTRLAQTLLQAVGCAVLASAGHTLRDDTPQPAQPFKPPVTRTTKLLGHLARSAAAVGTAKHSTLRRPRLTPRLSPLRTRPPPEERECPNAPARPQRSTQRSPQHSQQNRQQSRQQGRPRFGSLSAGASRPRFVPLRDHDEENYCRTLFPPAVHQD